MARTKGTYSLSANIEPRAAAPLDAREKVALITDLTTANTFPYPYEGMKVYCEEDKKLYILTGSDPTVAANWNEVGSGGSQTLTGLDDVDINLIEWDTKTWTGLTNFEGDYIWSDGENIYYSYSSNQYVLNKLTLTWSIKTWNGLTNIYGNHIWTDGENIYYSYGSSNQYVLDKSTSTWSPKEWTGLTNYIGDYIWTDGENIYYSFLGDQYILDKSTSTWSPKIWSGLTSFYGPGTWSDGDNIYYSVSSNQYVLDKLTSTWSPKTWTGLTNPEGGYIWLDGDNIYYSEGSNQYVLDKLTSTWSPKIWTGLTDFDSIYIWTDGNNIYYSLNEQNYKLNRTEEALIYDWANQKWINKEIVSKEDIPKIFTGTQAEWDALTTDEKLTYEQVNITDDESSTEGIKEYIKNQNILSGIESLTVADSTEYTAPYDGFIHITFSSFADTYFAAVVKVNDIIYDDVMIVVNGGSSCRHTFKIEVKKGDRWKFIWNYGSTGTSKEIVGTARYYKNRDYTGR